MKPFDKLIYVTRPIFPVLQEVMENLEHIWNEKRLTNVGSQHIALEENFPDYLKVPVSLFTNGSIALIVACQSLSLYGELTSADVEKSCSIIQSLFYANS